MKVYIVRSCYENNTYGTSHVYVEDVFSSIEKATDYIKDFDPENDIIYTVDRGVTYNEHGLPQRTLYDNSYLHTIELYCECWEVK